tara:strand:- start:109 stop:2031 length:1923 start_codon:yes stop_codon:yes gene_type:complete
MKIAYKHLYECIDSKPSLENISESLFQLGHEHEIEDEIFDIELTPNRGDCLSLNGILRDLAAFYKINFDRDKYIDSIDELSLNFTNKAQTACPHIAFLKIEIDKEPDSYKGKLNNYFKDLKLNKNNFFTDISNFISYETGQPTHCYDFLKIGDTFSLEHTNNRETFETLLEKKVELSDKNLVFIKNNQVINLAGIMGGKSTSCDQNTKSVIVECAYFNPEEIIGKSLKYDIDSEAAHKFERGVDSECHEDVLRRFLKIVSDHSTIKNTSIFFKNYKPYKNTNIPLDVSAINKIIGIQISEKEYIESLTKFGFEINSSNIKVPSYRNDIKNQNDLAEEIARMIGYDNIPLKKFKIQKHNNVNNIDNNQNNLKNFLIDNGFFEVINNPFTEKGSSSSIEVDNPLDSRKKYLRTDLKNSLINNLLYNERRQQDSIKLFEFSDIYTTKNPLEKKKLIGILATGRVGKNFKDFSNLINVNYLSSLISNIMPINNLNFEDISRADLDSKIKNPIAYLELDYDEICNSIFEYKKSISHPKNLSSFIKYKPISEFPKIYRDLSYSITDFSNIEKLQHLINEFEHKYLKEVFIFDFFKNNKQGFIKIGFRFIFQSENKTLLDENVNTIISKIVEQSLELSGVEIPGLER